MANVTDSKENEAKASRKNDTELTKESSLFSSFNTFFSDYYFML